MEKQNRKRGKQLLFRVTAEEKKLIQEKMRLVDMANFNAYARQMLKKGYIASADPSELKSLAAELQKIAVNIKQILRHVDTMGAACAADAEEIRQKLNECWDAVRQLFEEFTPEPVCLSPRVECRVERIPESVIAHNTLRAKLQVMRKRTARHTHRVCGYVQI